LNILALIGFLLAALFQAGTPTPLPGAVVRAVLLYSPTCPHCQKVILEDLPPMFEKYGEQLQVVGVDTSTSDGHDLFQSSIQRFNVPPERTGVPMLVVGEVVLVGSEEIPEQFPGLIEEHLEQGGVDWPDIPGLAELIAKSMAQTTPTAESQQITTTSPQPTSPTTQPTGSLATQSAIILSPTDTSISSGLILDEGGQAGVFDRLMHDPVGNALAIVVLIGMLIAVGAGVAFLVLPAKVSQTDSKFWLIPILCVIGFGVAGYLTYVETAQVTAICGPVGDCNTVQQSEYARLFGVLPIGALGMIGYVAIVLVWLVGYYGNGRLADLTWLSLLGMTLFGMFFSIYLTFLEPFVIGATCAWCVASAIIMTLLFWLSLTPGKSALSRLLQRDVMPVYEN